MPKPLWILDWISTQRGPKAGHRDQEGKNGELRRLPLYLSFSGSQPPPPHPTPRKRCRMCYCHTAIWWKDKICPQVEPAGESVQWAVCLEIIKIKTEVEITGHEDHRTIKRIQTGCVSGLFFFQKIRFFKN